MLASTDVASPDLPRRMSSRACLTAPRSEPEAALGAADGAESFECSATGVTSADSPRATSVGRGRGRGMDLGLARDTVPPFSQARAVAKARVEATAAQGNFIGPDDGGNRAWRIGDSVEVGKQDRSSFWAGRRPLGRSDAIRLLAACPRKTSEFRLQAELG